MAVRMCVSYKVFLKPNDAKGQLKCGQAPLFRFDGCGCVTRQPSPFPPPPPFRARKRRKLYYVRIHIEGGQNRFLVFDCFEVERAPHAHVQPTNDLMFTD